MDIVELSRKHALGKWRRHLFVLWVAAAIVVAVAAIIGGPLVSTDGAEGTAIIALISPIAMAIFVVSGLAWLIALVLSKRVDRPTD